MSSTYDPSFGGPTPPTAIEPAPSDVDALAEKAKSDLGELGTELKEQVGSLKEETAAQLTKVADKAKSLAAEQKDLLSEQVGGVVEAIEKVASELEGRNTASAGYIRFLADGAKNLSTTLDNNDVDALMSKAQQFGRQQPVAFMGAAALLGFAASRFLLASSKRSRSGMASPDTFVGADDGGL